MIKLIPAIVIALVVAAPALASPKNYSRSTATTTTYYSGGKQVGKAVSNGNTIRYYSSQGQPIGKSVRRR